MYSAHCIDLMLFSHSHFKKQPHYRTVSSFDIVIVELAIHQKLEIHLKHFNKMKVAYFIAIIPPNQQFSIPIEEQVFSFFLST